MPKPNGWIGPVTLLVRENHVTVRIGKVSDRTWKGFAMPWTTQDYPVTFKNMTPDVRDKAIEIANELLDQLG